VNDDAIMRDLLRMHGDVIGHGDVILLDAMVCDDANVRDEVCAWNVVQRTV
jgi:hypothetical protein